MGGGEDPGLLFCRVEAGGGDDPPEVIPIQIGEFLVGEQQLDADVGVKIHELGRIPAPRKMDSTRVAVASPLRETRPEIAATAMVSPGL